MTFTIKLTKVLALLATAKSCSLINGNGGWEASYDCDAGKVCTYVAGTSFTSYAYFYGSSLVFCATDGWDTETLDAEVVAANSSFKTWSNPVVFNEAFFEKFN